MAWRRSRARKIREFSPSLVKGGLRRYNVVSSYSLGVFTYDDLTRHTRTRAVEESSSELEGKGRW